MTSVSLYIRLTAPTMNLVLILTKEVLSFTVLSYSTNRRRCQINGYQYLKTDILTVCRICKDLYYKNLYTIKKKMIE